MSDYTIDNLQISIKLLLFIKHYLDIINKYMELNKIQLQSMKVFYFMPYFT